MGTAAPAKSQTIEDLPLAAMSQCNYGILTWSDAYIKVKSGGIDVLKIDSTLPTVISFGCLSQTEKTVLVVHSFVDGQPDDYLVVPKQWVMKIVPLKVEEK